jgi:hypothetical protein
MQVTVSNNLIQSRNLILLLSADNLNMKVPNSVKKQEWSRRAARKNAVVPFYFEVSPLNVFMLCGKCKTEFQRNLIINFDEPVFVCPNQSCRTRNWVPVTFNLHK